MLKYYNFDIVFSEIPDEVTLAINISNCPNRCKGCHSPWLMKDEGEPLTTIVLTELLQQYGNTITCICFMGGDRHPDEVEHLSQFVHRMYPSIKTGWYSGCSDFPANIRLTTFQYVKLGGYKEELGGLRSLSTNQRLYKIDARGRKEDITPRFWHPEKGKTAF